MQNTPELALSLSVPPFAVGGASWASMVLSALTFSLRRWPERSALLCTGAPTGCNSQVAGAVIAW